MIKSSVKKPFTVFVAVVVVLVLGAVSLTRMTTDLLPDMSIPYLMVITTDPGASPEKVETELSKPMESALGTVNGVKNITSTSSENYSLVVLEFESDTDMDSAMVKVSSAMEQVPLPDTCGKPNVMELSMDMMATMYVSVGSDSKDIYELSDFVSNTVIPELERQEGVASVSDMGLVDQTVEVRLNADKVDEVNDRILQEVSDTLAESKADIDDARDELDDAKDDLDDAEHKLNKEENNTANQLGEASLGMTTAIATQSAYQAQLNSQQANQAALQAELSAYQDAGVIENYDQMNTLFQTLYDSATGEAAYQAIYDEVYLQALIGAVQNVLNTSPNSEQTLPDSSEEDESTDAPADSSEESESTDAPADSSEEGESTDAPADSSEEGESTDAPADSSSTAEQASTDNSKESEPTDAPADSSSTVEEPTEPSEAMPSSNTSSSNTRTTDTTTVTVTADNVYSILDSMDPTVANTIKESCKEAAKKAAEEQIKQLKEKLPTDVEDALENSDKLAFASAMLGSQGQTDVAAALTVTNLTALSNAVDRVDQVKAEIANLNTEIAAAQAVLASVNEAVSMAINSYSKVEAGKILAAAGFGSGAAQIAAGQSAIESGQEQLDSAMDSYESARDTALKNANIDALVDASTLSNLIYAQNFEMPAGYLDDENDDQWLLKVGETYDSMDDMENMVLTHIDGVGNIRLKDVADLTLIDNAGDTYARVNGNDGIVLAIYKGSTAGTNAVSNVCNQAMAQIEAENSDIDVLNLMDQGEYITMFINSILSNIIVGAILAIIVLAVFLKDVKPTIVVAFSIPFSVVVALLLMYFTNITLNVMSMAGLSLAIGMLVDNSIVVIENIYRLRNRGLAAPRSAVQGAKQVESAIIASTLTTICVFLPMIFTTGYTRDMMLPFALTIAFALIASLVVALTVVPSIGSIMLRKTKTISHPLFDRIQAGYGVVLRWCLKFKIVPLALALLLLIFSVVEVSKMGIVMLPDMASNQIAVTLTLDDGIEKADAYAAADAVTNAILTVESVESVGSLGDTSSLMTGTSGGEDYSNYEFYVIPTDTVTKEAQVFQICRDIEAATAGLEGEVSVSSSAMGEMSSMMGSGLSISISGRDLDKLLDISADVEELVAQVEGFTDISNGQESGDPQLHLIINRKKAMKYGLTVAQIYSDISKKLTTEATNTSISMNDTDVEVTVVNETNTLTRENLLNMEFDVDTVNDDGETETKTHKLKEFASIEEGQGIASITRENGERTMTVTANTLDGYNVTRLTETLQPILDTYHMPDGYSITLGGEYEQVSSMVSQMMLMIALGLLFIYLVMVAQFQSLLSPFIIIFTVPLAFTGGLLGLLVMREQLSIMSLMGFLVLMGTVVNNGIVFVDYTNQLRLGGMEKRDALVATGKTRMRPILMTALTTILAMGAMVFSQDTSAGMSRGMAIVVAGGLIYATLMTLFIVPVMYDILFRKKPKEVDVGDDSIDDVPDDAAEFISEQTKHTSL